MAQKRQNPAARKKGGGKNAEKGKRKMSSLIIAVLLVAVFLVFVGLSYCRGPRQRNSPTQAAQMALQDRNLVAGNNFLENVANQPGVQKCESGLLYKVQVQGRGAVPTLNDKVRVHYRGTLIDGTEFDSSYQRGEPAEFPAGAVIKGWQQALTMMPVGSKWTLYIPQQLAYGPRAAGSIIKPYSALVFEVELLDIVK